MYKTEAEIAIHNFLKLLDKSNINIKYELQYYNKRDVIKELKERGLYDLCWYCEYPTPSGATCNQCIPCITHQTALWQLDNITPLTQDELACVHAIKVNPCDSVKEVEVGVAYATPISGS